MASPEVMPVLGSQPNLAAARTRRKPREPTASPAATARAPLTIPVGRRGSNQGTDAAGAGPSTSQPQQQAGAAGAAAPRQRQLQRTPAGDTTVDDDDVVIVSSGSESDDEVVITGVKQAPSPKRPRLNPPQQQQQQQQAPPGGQRVERGLHGGYFTMPTWDAAPQQQQQAPGSPEPMFKCLVCLEGIKPDNMGITPCGHMFCYNCIVEAVRATKKCPKCRKGATLKNVKKIFPN